MRRSAIACLAALLLVAVSAAPAQASEEVDAARALIASSMVMLDGPTPDNPQQIALFLQGMGGLQRAGKMLEAHLAANPGDLEARELVSATQEAFAGKQHIIASMKGVLSQAAGGAFGQMGGSLGGSGGGLGGHLDPAGLESHTAPSTFGNKPEHDLAVAEGKLREAKQHAEQIDAKVAAMNPTTNPAIAEALSEFYEKDIETLTSQGQGDRHAARLIAASQLSLGVVQGWKASGYTSNTEQVMGLLASYHEEMKESDVAKIQGEAHAAVDHVDAEIRAIRIKYNMPLVKWRSTPPGTEALQAYTHDMTDLAAKGKYKAAIGRDDEIHQVAVILNSKDKKNIALTGGAGIGKTAIVEGLAQLIVADEVPQSLRHRQLLEIDLNLVMGADKPSKVIAAILKEVKERTERGDAPILFIDEMHRLMEGNPKLIDMLKPALARGEIQVIGATTEEEYKVIVKAAAADRRFVKKGVDEPSRELAFRMIKANIARYEWRMHKNDEGQIVETKIDIPDEVIWDSIDGAKRYRRDKFLPDSANDLVDQAAAEVDIAQGHVVTSEDIAERLSEITGIPPDRLAFGAKADGVANAKMAGLPAALKNVVKGQDSHLDIIAAAIQRQHALPEPNKPISMLVLGPTGVGKTETAKQLAAFLFDDETAMTRIDMSEYMEKHSAERFGGSPPGYVGYGEGGQLTESVRKRPYQVILFDEVEKAHDDVQLKLLQVLDDGRMTDGEGRTVDFSNTIIIMTSNLPAPAGAQGDELRKALMATKRMRPEFVNRIDEVVSYDQLDKSTHIGILDNMLKGLSKRAALKGFKVTFSRNAKLKLLETGIDPDFGARPLKRKMGSTFGNAIADEIFANRAGKGDSLHVDVDAHGKFVATKLAAAGPAIAGIDTPLERSADVAAATHEPDAHGLREEGHGDGHDEGNHGARKAPRARRSK